MVQHVKNALISILLLICLVSCQRDDTATGTQEAPSYDDLGYNTIPYAASLSTTSTLNLDKGIYIVPALAKTPLLAKTLSTFVADLKTLQISSSDPEGIALKVNVTGQESIAIDLTTDESYNLNIKSSHITITCPNHVGLSRALSTLSQLLFLHKEGASLPIVNIKDQPRFAYRGLMVDACRHWIPKGVLIDIIKCMSAAKLNVLHLHLSDDQSFRVESKKLPLLNSKGSDGNYYSYEDIKEIVLFAYQSGIRVIPGFDIPGHASSILAGYPELSADLSRPISIEKAYGIHKAVLDPTSDKTYAFIKTLFTEMSTLFSDDYIHVGGGEVRYDNWQSSKRITDFMKKNELVSPVQLHGYFTIRIQRILKELGKKMIAWDEALRPELPTEDDIAFQSRLGRSSLNQSVQLGYQSIFSVGWMLDQNLSSEEMYKIDPIHPQNDIIVSPDTSAYRIFDLSSSIGDKTISGFLYVFGKNPNNLTGIIQFPGQAVPFDRASMSDGTLQFQNTDGQSSVIAQINYDDDFIINGSLSIDGLPFNISGSMVGGDDMSDGMKLPAFASSTPLTPRQKDLIIGGEACMWGEWVNADNIISRIWPRASTVADKLWSPYQSSSSGQYQRQVQFQKYLEALGLNSNEPRKRLVESITDYPKALQLETFIDALEVVKGSKRFLNNVDHDINSPLDKVADAISPESMSAYRIGEQVDLLLKKGASSETRVVIEAQLTQWAPLYRELEDLFSKGSKIESIEVLALALSDLAKISLHVMESGTLTDEESTYYDRLKLNAQREIDGVYLGPAKHMIRLIDSYRSQL